MADGQTGLMDPDLLGDDAGTPGDPDGAGDDDANSLDGDPLIQKLIDGGMSEEAAIDFRQNSMVPKAEFTKAQQASADKLKAHENMEGQAQQAVAREQYLMQLIANAQANPNNAAAQNKAQSKIEAFIAKSIPGDDEPTKTFVRELSESIKQEIMSTTEQMIRPIAQGAQQVQQTQDLKDELARLKDEFGPWVEEKWQEVVQIACSQRGLTPELVLLKKYKKEVLGGLQEKAVKQKQKRTKDDDDATMEGFRPSGGRKGLGLEGAGAGGSGPKGNHISTERLVAAANRLAEKSRAKAK